MRWFYELGFTEAQILSAHKIIIGFTEFDYDQMTVKNGFRNSGASEKGISAFVLNWQHRRDVHYKKQQLMDDV